MLMYINTKFFQQKKEQLSMWVVADVSHLWEALFSSPLLSVKKPVEIHKSWDYLKSKEYLSLVSI